MRGDGDNRELPAARAITPEHAVSAWRLILHVDFEHFLAAGALKSGVLMAVQARMPKIGLKQG